MLEDGGEAESGKAYVEDGKREEDGEGELCLGGEASAEEHGEGKDDKGYVGNDIEGGEAEELAVSGTTLRCWGGANEPLIREGLTAGENADDGTEKGEAENCVEQRYEEAVQRPAGRDIGFGCRCRGPELGCEAGEKEGGGELDGPQTEI